MSAKRILRSVLVAVVAVGLLIGPAGSAAAAPDRGEGARGGWAMEVGEWVGVVWGWLSGQAGPSVKDGDEVTPRNQDDGSCGACSDAGPNLDPDG